MERPLNFHEALQRCVPFFRNLGRLLPRSYITQTVCRKAGIVNSRTVDTHVAVFGQSWVLFLSTARSLRQCMRKAMPLERKQAATLLSAITGVSKKRCDANEVPSGTTTGTSSPRIVISYLLAPAAVHRSSFSWAATSFW